MLKFKNKAKQQVIDYQAVFDTESGKRVLHDLMKVGHVLTPSHVRGDATETAFREGERNMVLRIMTILKTDPAHLEQLIKEGEEYEYGT